MELRSQRGLAACDIITDRVNIAGATPISASELRCKLANERPNGSGTELFYSIDSCFSLLIHYHYSLQNLLF